MFIEKQDNDGVLLQVLMRVKEVTKNLREKEPNEK